VTRRFAWWSIVVSVVVFGLCALVAVGGGVPGAEQAVFRVINGLPDVLSPGAEAIQYLGVLAVGPIVAIVALVFRRPRLAVAALLVTVLKLLMERFVWKILQVHRRRPAITEDVVIIRGDTMTTGLSFVSGHVILVTGLAWVITPFLRGRWRIAPWIVVAAVGLARIYLGAHNPLDVVGGMALGTVVGATTFLLLRLDRTDAASRSAAGRSSTEG
jgi:undecaprenyl-diphosphatase